MVTRTWVGGTADNDAGNGANWSPTGAPEAGDTLIVGSGTIAVSNNDLAGNTLSVDYPTNGGPTPLIEVNNAKLQLNAVSEVEGGGLTIDASGRDQISFLQPEPTIFTPTIDLAANAKVKLTGDNSFFTLQFHGDQGSRIINDGTLSYIQTGSVIDTNLAGTGTVNVNRAHDGPATLEMNGTVARSQTFDLSSDAFHATLQIDQPNAFKGLVDVTPDSDFGLASLILEGLQASSFDLKNDMLRLFNGNKVVDTLRLTNQSGEPMTVTQSGSNIVIDFGTSNTPGMILPPHN